MKHIACGTIVIEFYDVEVEGHYIESGFFCPRCGVFYNPSEKDGEIEE